MNELDTVMSPARAPRAWTLPLAAVALVAFGAVGGVMIARHGSAPAAPDAAVAQAPAAIMALQPSATATTPAAVAEVPARPATSQLRVDAATTMRPAESHVCASCGVVTSVHTETRKGDGTGVGAVAGGVVGGLVGHQIGGGSGRTATTVLGAVSGGMAGNEIEKHARASTVYVVRVRMDDGTQRSFTRSTPLEVGQRVSVDGQGPHFRHG